MTTEERYNIVLKKLIDMGVSIEPKASKWYWRALGAVVYGLTFGQLNFMKNATTTIGAKIITPSDWDYYGYDVKYEILLHEANHVALYKKYGRGNLWLGAVLVGFAYAFLPLPLGLAYCRMRIEKAGYEESIRSYLQVGGRERAQMYREFIIQQFTGASYLWMWPFRSNIEKWFDAAVERIAAEEGV